MEMVFYGRSDPRDADDLWIVLSLLFKGKTAVPMESNVAGAYCPRAAGRNVAVSCLDACACRDAWGGEHRRSGECRLVGRCGSGILDVGVSNCGDASQICRDRACGSAPQTRTHRLFLRRRVLLYKGLFLLSRMVAFGHLAFRNLCSFYNRRRVEHGLYHSGACCYIGFFGCLIQNGKDTLCGRESRLEFVKDVGEFIDGACELS